MRPEDEVTERRTRVRALESRRDFQGVVRELATVARDELLRDPALGYTLAVAWRATGESERSLGLIEDLEVPVGRSGVERLQRQRLNLESALRFERGEVEAARSLWERVLDLATAADDHDLVAKASNNLGVLHTLQGRPEEAIAAYGRARAACQRLGDRRGLAQAHQNLAINYREGGHAEEADAHFRLAMDHARSIASNDVLGRAEEERAILFLMAGDVAMAEASAQRAMERLEKIGDAAGRAESLRVLGLVALSTGRLDRAETLLGDALRQARATSSALLEAETLECLASLHRGAGDGGAADEAAASARALFRRLGAEAWGTRLRERLQTRAYG